jgi:FMN-dependent NADH-azoreductase
MQMPTMLAIAVSPRFERSVSRDLLLRFVQHWRSAHPGGRVIHRDLMKTRLPFVDQWWIGGAFLPPERQSVEMKDAIRISDELTAELLEADHIAIASPMFNFTIPAALKAYIDQIVRVGVTVTPGYQGMLQGRKATVILASGSRYDRGAKWESSDNASAYLKQILGFLRIMKVAVVLAGETLAIERGETTPAEFASRFEGELAEAAGA